MALVSLCPSVVGQKLSELDDQDFDVEQLSPVVALTYVVLLNGCLGRHDLYFSPERARPLANTGSQ